MSFASALATFVIAECALAIIMAAAWTVVRATGQTGWVDSIWTFGVGATAAVLALAPSGGGEGWRRAAVAAAVALWALRLGGHIFARTRKTPDDPRYRALIEGWGEAAPLRLFGFLQIQAAAGAALALAVALAAHAGAEGLRLQDALGALVFAAALAGEASADAQLARFRANAANRGKICDVGLWARSRHPNYFFEWLVWVAFAIAATGTVTGLLAWAAPALMYAALRHGSGVPPLEEHMARTRGEAFRAYAQRTPVFFPKLL